MMSLKFLKSTAQVGLLAIACLVTGQTTSQAGVIGFDSNGGGDNFQNVATFDFAPGNALFQNLGSLLVNKTDQGMTNYMQTRLANLIDGNGTDFIPPGLNSTYELTIFIGFSGAATVSGTRTNYTLDTTNPEPINFFEIWYDDFTTGTQANDLAGTGFRDGLKIFEGEISSAQGGFTRYGAPTNFDGYANQDYPGVTTYRVAGGVILNINALSADPAFFQQVPPLLTVGLYNSSNITAFRQADPSRLFDGLVPGIGNINGTSNDFQAQIDPNATFEAIPEPSTIVITSLAICGLVFSLTRRRNSQN
jgi:hypothetical protein